MQIESTRFLALLKQRQSVRKYSDAPVEEEKLERCLEAARVAPSACNAQPWKLVVDDPVSDHLRPKVRKQMDDICCYNRYQSS